MKRAPKMIGIGVLALLAAAGVLAAQALYRFDLRINPVAAAIKSHVIKWGDKTDLTPQPFQIGEDRADVVALLRKSGFARTPDEKVWKLYVAEILDGKELYQREANNLVCMIRLYVFVKFDGGARLVSANGTQHEHGCL